MATNYFYEGLDTNDLLVSSCASGDHHSLYASLPCMQFFDDFRTPTAQTVQDLRILLTVGLGCSARSWNWVELPR